MSYFEAPNARALNQLCTWLGVVGIRYELDPQSKFLTVWRANGDPAELAVVVGQEDTHKGAIVIQGKVLTGRRISEALALFRDLQMELGYEPQCPVDRGAPPEHKAHYSSDFELVALRHMELRRVPNPPRAVLKKFEKIVASTARKFFYSEQQLCEDHMLDLDDLQSFAMVWATNFAGLHSVPETVPEAETENKRLLTDHLKQRFTNFRDLLWKKGRNIVASLDAAFIGRNACPFEYTDKGLWFQTLLEGEEVDEAYLSRHRKLAVHNPTARRSSALLLLDKQLASLPHDAFIKVLQEAAGNGWIHVDAQKLAARRLREHARTCEACGGLLSSKQDEAGEDLGGPIE